MLTWREVGDLERQIKSSIVTLNEKNLADITLVEAIDNVKLWPESFDRLAPVAPSSATVDTLLARVPLLMCAIASEIGFRFEGVGTAFWAKFSDALGVPINMAHRQQISETFDTLATRYNLAKPTESAFSAHFSIISWPIANALLPLDLVGPVARLMARAPVGALPGPSRAPNFASLRAWASAAEGARLSDWLRFEASAARVLTALLTENRGSVLPETSYARLWDVIATKPESFFAARTARLRTRTATVRSPARILGQLSAKRDHAGVRLFVGWPTLPPAIYDNARFTARAAGWRPRLWGGGALLHPDNALSAGPFALILKAAPLNDEAAYPDAAQIFGEGSDIAAALAARSVDWAPNLLFDPNRDHTQAEQRFDVPTGTSGCIWVAAKAGGTRLDGLRELGNSCGYRFFEADLANTSDRGILTREGLLSGQTRTLIARHPFDAISASQGVIRPDRPFLSYEEGTSPELGGVLEKLAVGAWVAAVSGPGGRPGLRCEAAPAAGNGVVDLILFERDSAFEALVEGRLQLRVESSLPLLDVPITAELEMGGKLIARGRDRLSALPTTVSATSALLAPLYEDAVRGKLLDTGRGTLQFVIGRSALIRIPLERPAASVEWSDDAPRLIDSGLESKLVRAIARSPHRFEPAAAVEVPARGVTAYGLRLSDGRIADPIRLFISKIFDLGDLAAHFGDDLGSRRMFDNGCGVGDIARSRVAWARALCTSLTGVGAKTYIVRQFEEPLVYDLCGKGWYRAEQASKDAPSDPHKALWAVAIEREPSLVTIPCQATPDQTEIFATAFRKHARVLDPEWPHVSTEPVDGAMDEALNAAFSEAVAEWHAKGELLDVDEDEFDFGSPAEYWNEAATEAVRRVSRFALVRLIAPSEGGLRLSSRSYAELTIAELAEDLSAWTRT